MSETQTTPAPEAAHPPHVQEAMKKAEAEGKTVTTDNNGNVFVTQKPPNKNDIKRQQQYVARVKRTMGKHKCSEQEALKLMEEEDYESLSPKEHVKRLDFAVNMALKAVAKDIKGLRLNDEAIADSFDINYRGIAALFSEYHIRIAVLQELLIRKLGVTDEEITAVLNEIGPERATDSIELQRRIMTDSHQTFMASKEAKAKAHAEASKKKMDEDSEAKTMNDELARLNAEAGNRSAPAGDAPPENTEFGGDHG